MGARASAWALLGGISKVESRASSAFSLWSAKSGEFRFVQSFRLEPHVRRGMGMEVCTTLGMLSPDQARRLKEAGLTAYNHNLDTSREFYPSVRAMLNVPDRVL